MTLDSRVERLLSSERASDKFGQSPLSVSPRGTVLSHKKKYGAKQMRYADGGGMSTKWEEAEMRTKTKKEGRACTS